MREKVSQSSELGEGQPQLTYAALDSYRFSVPTTGKDSEIDDLNTH